MHTPRMPAVAEGQRQWLGGRQSGSSNAPDLHPKESWLHGLLAAQLTLLPWALGSVHLWAQLLNLALALPAFVIALLPRHYNAELARGPSFDLKLAPKLFRFPVFWLGLLLLLYIAIQLLNPAWQFQSNDKGAWWLQAVPHASWLPHGIAGAPVTKLLVPPWQALLPLLAAFLDVCAIWIGFTRRKTVVFLLTVLCVNVAVLSLLSMVQRLATPDLIFGFYKSQSLSPIGPFIYRNHAAAYFNLVVALCCARALHAHLRSEQRMGKSSPAVLFLFLAIAAGVVVLASCSRAGVALLLVSVLLFLGLLISLHFAGRRLPGHPAILGACTVLFLGFVVFSAYNLRASDVLVRYKELLSRGSISVEARSAATEATLKLAKDNLYLGNGWGSLRFLFPSEQLRSERKEALGVDAKGRIRSFWQHAHNDYAEYLMELGIFGLLPVALCFLYFPVQLVRLRFWRHTPILLLGVGLGMTMLHSRVDFQVSNPAVFVTWCCLWPLALRWTEIENTSQALARNRPL